MDLSMKKYGPFWQKVYTFYWDVIIFLYICSVGKRESFVTSTKNITFTNLKQLNQSNLWISH